MAYDLSNMEYVILQDPNTWSATQNHPLGSLVRDRKLGKLYQYVCLGAARTGLGVVSSGTPVGPYIVDANSTYTAGYVSAGFALAGSNVIGVARGQATAALPYGWIEVVEKGMITTVNCSWCAIVPGNTLVWDADGSLQTISVFNASVCAIAVDSHRTSYSQNSVLLTTTVSVTPISVKWL